MSQPTSAVARYPFHVRWSDEDDAYLGSIPGLIGDCCHGDTPEEVLVQLHEIGDDLVSYLAEQGQKLPAVPALSADPDPALTRKAMGLSQAEFARLLAVSLRTLHKWEQHTSRPSGAARALLKIAAAEPQAVKRVLSRS
jgi:putative transcriptional regulator